MKQNLLYFLVVFFLLPQVSSAQNNSCQSARAYFGVFSDKISSDKANQLGFSNPYGSYVAKVINNTAAKKIGIQPFDYIIGINEDQTSADKGFVALLCKYQPKEKVKVHFIRNGELKSSEVILGSSKNASCEEKRNRAFWGVDMIKEETVGVKIKVVPNSSAEKMELKDGDLITKINNHPIIDWRDLSIAISNLKPNDLIQVEFIRDNKRMISTGHIGKFEDKNKSNTDLGYESKEPTKTILSDELSLENTTESFKPYQAPEILIEQIQTNELSDNESNPIIDLSLVNDLKIEKLNLYTSTEQGIFYLSFLLPEIGNTSIKLYNDLGDLVYQYDLNDFGGTFRDEVDLSDTPRGIYFMEVSQNSKSVNKKITLL